VIPQDFLGREIKPGDHVVYPQRASSSLWVNYAEVLEAVPVNDSWGRQTIGLKVKILKSSGYVSQLGRTTTIKVIERVTVVDAR
jgi:hypothetical protein